MRHPAQMAEAGPTLSTKRSASHVAAWDKPIGGVISLNKGAHPDLAKFVLDTNKKQFAILTNALFGTGVPPAGDTATSHNLLIRIEVPTAGDTVVLRSPAPPSCNPDERTGNRHNLARTSGLTKGPIRLRSLGLVTASSPALGRLHRNRHNESWHFAVPYLKRPCCWASRPRPSPLCSQRPSC